MKKLLILFFLFSTFISFSQTKNKTENAIDTAESKCLSQDNLSNAEMCNCTIKARES